MKAECRLSMVLQRVLERVVRLKRENAVNTQSWCAFARSHETSLASTRRMTNSSHYGVKAALYKLQFCCGKRIQIAALQSGCDKKRARSRLS